MMIPIMAATTAHTKTALAAMSFASLAFSFLYGIAISTIFSKAVFINSLEITAANNIKHIIHSNWLILKINPAIIKKI